MKNNLAKLQTIPAKLGADALLVTSPENRQYATGFHSSGGIALITADRAWFFTDFRYIEAARAKIEGFEIEMIDRARNYVTRINEKLAELGAKKLAYESLSMSVSEYEDWKGKISAELVPAGNAFYECRRSKEPWELELMIKAQRIAEAALAETMKMIKPGVTEQEVAAELVYRILLGGAEDISFNPIVVSGANSSMPHGVPSDKPIEAGDFVTMDFGAKYQGYCSDMTRTVAVGYATDEMKKIYGIVLEAQKAGIAAARAGVTGKSIDAAARKVIEDAGYGEYFGHSFGHSLGLEIHEPPNAAPTDETVLPEGDAISAEPGIYLPGKFGVRIEDVIVLRKDGCDDLMLAPKELIIL